MTGKLPDSASIAYEAEGAKLFAPSAERNAPALTALMKEIAPEKGTALEIASGTGQHISAFATACPEVNWQPTELAAARIASVDAYTESLVNVCPTLRLDASIEGWGARAQYDLVVLCNLLHLIPAPAATVVLEEAAQTLKSGGHFIVYGPFKRSGALTSEGDQKFDAELRAADPAIGYKNDSWISERLQIAGLEVTCREMPANNLAFIGQKSDGKLGSEIVVKGKSR